MKHIRKIFLVLWGFLLAGFVAQVLFYFFMTHGARGKHVAHVDWLPVEASDVTFTQSTGLGAVTCYECSLPKDVLDRMAEHEGWRLEPKSNFHVERREILGLPALQQTVHGEGNVVAKALVYDFHQPNGGGVTVVYDLSTSRLFVHKSHS